MSFKWMDSHTVGFLEEYQKQDCLWNPKSLQYNNSAARERAYSKMVYELNLPGLTVPDIKTKIKSIRTRYVAELNKIMKSKKMGEKELYEPRLFWFKDADLFLRSVSNPNFKTSDPNEVEIAHTSQPIPEKKRKIAKVRWETVKNPQPILHCETVMKLQPELQCKTVEKPLQLLQCETVEKPLQLLQCETVEKPLQTLQCASVNESPVIQSFDQNEVDVMCSYINIKLKKCKEKNYKKYKKAEKRIMKIVMNDLDSDSE